MSHVYLSLEKPAAFILKGRELMMFKVALKVFKLQALDCKWTLVTLKTCRLKIRITNNLENALFI